MTSAKPDDLAHQPVILLAGTALCEIWPQIGGSIGRWSIGGQEMFRHASTDAIAKMQALAMASFPLVPYSNRIGDARFDWAGTSHHIAANVPPEPHAIHGTGWTATWQAAQDSEHSVTLRFAHAANAAWPWPFAAEQRITLHEEGLIFDLAVRNLADETVPLAFGLHPYFDCKGATLSFNAAQVWRTGEDGLPAYCEAPHGMFDFANGLPVQGRVLDNGYAQWEGIARIRWLDRPRMLVIKADCEAAVVYVPQGDDFFCFEPVPHINNALNLPGHAPQMPMVVGGGTYSAMVAFHAMPASSG